MATGCVVVETSVIPGDYALQGEPGCTDTFDRAMAMVERGIAAYEATASAGPYVAGIAAVVGAVSGSIGGEVGIVLDDLTGGQRFASCKAFGVTVGNMRIPGFNAYDRFRGGSWFGPVRTDGQGPDDSWKRVTSAGVESTRDGFAVLATLKNWSHDQTAEGRLVVFVEETDTTPPPPPFPPPPPLTGRPPMGPHPAREFVCTRASMVPNHPITFFWKNNGDYWTQATDDPASTPNNWKVVEAAFLDGNTGTVVRSEDNATEMFIPFIGNTGASPDWLRERDLRTNSQWKLYAQMTSPK